MNTIQNLLIKTNSIVEKYNELLDNTGGRFNVFKIIGLETQETRLHSAFLAELLNPCGSHGLREKPLNAFIKHCIDDNFEFETNQALCTPEYYIGPLTDTTGGRIDIIIKDQMKRSIIIENKINAGDQQYQMLRYHNHSKNYISSQLIYLSLDGKSPTSYSTGGIEFAYKPISYKYDIINWLTECKSIAVDFPLVREALTHYINLIKQLTNTSTMDKMKNDIVSLIMRSTENIQSAFELEKALSDVKIKLQWEFWTELETALRNRGVNIKGEDDPKKVKFNKVQGYYEKQRNKDTHYGLWCEIYNKDGITIHWGCEIESNIYWGFTIERNGIGNISDNDEFKIYRDIVRECDERYQLDSNDWLGWQYPTPKLNFGEFNSDEIFALTEKHNLEKTVSQIAEKVSADIRFVQNKLNEK